MNRRVARQVLRVGRRAGATRKELLAAGVTGFVESDFENLSGGDADSAGWRQERAMYYDNPTNVRASAGRFFKELRAHRGKGLSVGELAQAVQRSAYPDRYQTRLGDARRLVGAPARAKGDLSGFRGSPGGRSTTGKAPGQDGPLAGLLAPENPGAGVAGLLGAMNVENPPVPQTGPTLPAFNARRFLSMPAGFQAPASAPPAPKGPDLSELIELSRGAGGGDALPMPEAGQGEVGGAPAKPAPAKPPRGGDGRGGSINVASGADRPGVGTSREVKRFVRRVSGIYGQSLTIGTGTSHNQMTVDGNVSDHWGGHAADVPAKGKALTRLGQAALVAAGMPKSQARKIKGGLYNVKGHQIIFNTNQGGNHFDHLHVSA